MEFIKYYLMLLYYHLNQEQSLLFINYLEHYYYFQDKFLFLNRQHLNLNLQYLNNILKAYKVHIQEGTFVNINYSIQRYLYSNFNY